MNFCRSSLTTLRKLMQALSDADPALRQELTRIADDTKQEDPLPAVSSTAMALSQLGLIDRIESGSNLSV